MLRPEGGNGAAATLGHTLTQARFVIANKRGVFKVFKACSRVFFIFHLDLFSQSGSVWAEFTALHESRGRPILHPGSCFSQLLLGLIVLQHVRATELLLFTLVGTFLLYKSILHSLEKKNLKNSFSDYVFLGFGVIVFWNIKVLQSPTRPPMEHIWAADPGGTLRLYVQESWRTFIQNNCKVFNCLNKVDQ